LVITLTEAGGASITLASDGEAHFDPFGVGFDISAGVQLVAGGANTWSPDNTNGAFNAGFWTTGGAVPAGTWVLPAVTPCGVENEPSCEPIGVWDYSAPLPPLTLIMLEAGGGYSKGILTRNSGPNGDAVLVFASDPSVLIPEPSTWAMMLIGFAGLGYLGYRSQKRRSALAI
jgi:hypothetical protein